MPMTDEGKHMKRMMMAFLLVLTVGCGNTTGGDDTNGGGGGGGGGGGSTLPQGLCNANNRCPDGQFCFNGICAPGCTSNKDCGDSMYCDTEDIGPPYYCKNKSVPTCTADSQCAQSQVCLKGLCSLKPPEAKAACEPDRAGSAEDGCDKYSICNDPNEENNTKQDAYCASFPPCPQSGVCPTGQFGAVCNDGYLTGKARFCMEGLCRDNSNCPSSWNCVKPYTNAVLGFCSSGAPGMPCTDNAQCASNSCASFRLPL